LLSPTTAQEDRTTKKKLYERTFNTREYFLYDPDTRQLEGYRLHGINGYEAIEPEQEGRLWSKQLELYLGLWHGQYLGPAGSLSAVLRRPRQPHPDRPGRREATRRRGEATRPTTRKPNWLGCASNWRNPGPAAAPANP
jgi:hypothetical protein